MPASIRITRRRFGRAAAAVAAGLAAPTLRAQPSGSLRMGIVPYLPPRALIGLFEPLRAHVSARIGQDVVSYSAVSFRALAESARAGEYDLAFMPAHFLRLAARDWKFTLLARPIGTSHAVLVVRADDTIRDPQELRGRVLVTSDPLSIVSIIARDWLRQNRLAPGRDVRVEASADATSTRLALQRPEVAAIALAASQLADFAEEDRRGVRVLLQMRAIVPPGWAARAGLAPDLVQRLRAALLSFGGAADSQSLARAALAPLQMRDLDGLDAMADEVRRALSATPR